MDREEKLAFYLLSSQLSLNTYAINKILVENAKTKDDIEAATLIQKHLNTLNNLADEYFGGLIE